MADVVRDRADGANTTPSSAAEATPSAKREDKTRDVDGLITGNVCQTTRPAGMLSIAIAMHQPLEGVDIELSGGTFDIETKS